MARRERVLVWLATALVGCPAHTSVDAGACTAAQALCGATCADLRVDDAHCGACGRGCSTDEGCAAGECFPRACDDFDCTSSYVCVTAQCAERTCVGVLCPQGEACLQGVCLPTQCGSTVCPPGSVCRAGGCVDRVCLGVLCPPSLACVAGACLAPCVEAEPCAPGNPCALGTTDCSSGAAVCTVSGFVDAGAVCGGGFCDGTGQCSGCNAGAACQPSTACARGAIDCSTGSPVCQSAGPSDAGEPCDAGVCNGAGQCGPGCADPHWSQVVLLMHFDDPGAGDSGFADATGRHVFTNHSASIATAQSRFGGASVRFSGVSYVATPDSSDFDLGAQDFTLEAWVYRTGSSTLANTVVGQWPAAASSTKSFFMGANTSNQFGLAYSLDGPTTSMTPGALRIPTNQWRHVAATRSGGVIRAFVDGVDAGTVGETNPFFNSNADVTIGAVPAFGGGWVGNIDELRITKGVARYTAPFSPPTGPFPSCP